MRILVLGTGDAFTRRSFPASALIEAPGGYVLLDCPDLIHRALYEASTHAGWSVDVDAIHDVLITHLHGDHCNGLEAFLFARTVSRARNPEVPLPRVFTNREAGERLWERLAPAMERQGWFGRAARPEDYYQLQPLDCDAEVSVAGLRVRCRRTRHTVPTCGYLIADGRWTLGWSGDTPFEAEHLAWLDRADLIVHETGPGPVHTPIEKLNTLPTRLRRKLRLIHAPDDFDASLTDISVLNDGEVLDAKRPTPA